jgi:hypothetical protein
MGKSKGILLDCLCEALGVENRELIHRLLPVVRRSAPVGRDIAQRQPDQLARRVIARKVAARLDDLAQPRIGKRPVKSP